MVAWALFASLFSSCILPPNTNILNVHSPHYNDSKIKTRQTQYGQADVILKPETDCLLLKQQHKVKS